MQCDYVVWLVLFIGCVLGLSWIFIGVTFGLKTNIQWGSTMAEVMALFKL
jgi:hypothetical protein